MFDVSRLGHKHAQTYCDTPLPTGLENASRRVRRANRRNRSQLG